MNRFYQELVRAAGAGTPFALALIAGVKGSSPQRQGAKALFFPDGRVVGTLGGGCLEAEVHARARKALQTGQPSSFEMVLDHIFGWDDGLICGGSVHGLILPQAASALEIWRTAAAAVAPREWGVTSNYSIAWVENEPGAEWLYRETVAAPPCLWIAGSGHVAQAVVPLALQLEFAVTVFDDRPELANHQWFPPATELRVGGWHELLKEPLPAPPTYGLIVTRGHQHDALVLSEWIHRPFVFLGMIGSRRKARLIREQFLRQSVATAGQLDKVSCPVGVNIGARTTPEIAVSILAQFIQKRAEYVSAKTQPHPPVSQPQLARGA